MKSQRRAGYQGSEQIPAVAKQYLHSEADCFKSAGSRLLHDNSLRREDGAEPGSPLPSPPHPPIAVHRGHFFLLAAPWVKQTSHRNTEMAPQEIKHRRTQ